MSRNNFGRFANNGGSANGVFADPLLVTNVDLKKDENRKLHRTDKYQENALIIRRGQPFGVSITLSREYLPFKDRIFLEFVTGNNPKKGKPTWIRLPVKESLNNNPDTWSAAIINHSQQHLSLQVRPSAESIVGTYKMLVETCDENGGQINRVTVSDAGQDAAIYILFNAYCEDDPCFMENEEERKEYVMNTVGSVYQGTSKTIHAKRWKFGQFTRSPLHVALYLMGKASLPSGAQSSPAHVTRCLSKMVNSLDNDAGVLVGNWSGEYSDGMEPWSWNGSVRILDQYWRTKTPVKYGQCWVFSGVVTTLCRALGLPTRSVTNFDSAHDSDQSNTIDYYFNANNEYLSGDSICSFGMSLRYWNKIKSVQGKGVPEELEKNQSLNFHVWNESWFKRHDLPEGNDGWQAHDATPQETSEGYFQCGPAPVAAIKKGEVFYPYDGGFLFAEVNGDVVYWRYEKDGSLQPVYVVYQKVGKKISTKSLGADHSAQDITGNYKFPEGSEEERKATAKAHSHRIRSSNARGLYKNFHANDVTLKEEFPGSVFIGQDVDAHVMLQNTANANRNVSITFTSVLVYYTGAAVGGRSRPRNTIEGRDVDKYDIQLKPQESINLTHPIKAAEYIPMMVSGADMMKICAVAEVKETKRSLYVEDVVEFEKPKVNLTVSGEIRVGREFELVMSIVNPLPISLNGGLFSYEGDHEPNGGEIALRGPVEPYGKAEVRFSMKALQGGDEDGISAGFTSRELSGCEGSLDRLMVV